MTNFLSFICDAVGHANEGDNFSYIEDTCVRSIIPFYNMDYNRNQSTISGNMLPVAENIQSYNLTVFDRKKHLVDNRQSGVPRQNLSQANVTLQMGNC